MDKIRILAIVPYNQLEGIVKEAASQYGNIQIETVTGVYPLSSDLPVDFFKEHYDVIIARGGTAVSLKSVTDTPVIEIPINTYDILRAMSQARQMAERIVVVSYPDVCGNARYLSAFLGWNIDCVEFSSIDEIGTTVKNCADAGYELMICGGATGPYAEKYGIRYLQIMTGREAVDEALGNAVRQYEYVGKLNRTADFYRFIANNSASAVLVYDENRHMTYANRNAIQLLSASSKPDEILSRMIADIEKSGMVHVTRKIDGSFYDIDGERMDTPGPHYLFQVSFRNAASRKYSPVTIESPEEVSHYLYDEPYSELYFRPVAGAVEHAAFSELPVLIHGETGTLKNVLARIIYSGGYSRQGRRTGIHSLIVIDCASLSTAFWNDLMGNSSSLIHSTGHTVYFNRIDELDIQLQKQIYTYISISNLAHRHRIISSCTRSLADETAKGRFVSDLCHVISSYQIEIPPLRERKADIPTLISHLLPVYNEKHSKEVAGLEPEAVRIMTEFEWPLNMMQLEMLMDQLTATAESYYITAEAAAAVLPEKTVSPDTAAPAYKGTLEDIEKNIIEQVLREEGMNQSAAAKRLHIGRSTLRRKIGLQR